MIGFTRFTGLTCLTCLCQDVSMFLFKTFLYTTQKPCIVEAHTSTKVSIYCVQAFCAMKILDFKDFGFGSSIRQERHSSWVMLQPLPYQNFSWTLRSTFLKVLSKLLMDSKVRAINANCLNIIKVLYTRKWPHPKKNICDT